jgi:proline iminopeptidase
MRWFFGAGQQAARYDLRDRLGEISLPTLVITGGYDWVCPPVAARTLATGIPDSELALIPDAGHFPFSEEPEQFGEAIACYLDTHISTTLGR